MQEQIMDYSDAPENELVSYVKLGVTLAFSELYTRNYYSVLDYVSSLSGNFHDGEDITQEAFSKAYQNISKFRADSSFATWTRRIARQLFLRKIRTKQPAFVPFHEAENIIAPIQSSMLQSDIAYIQNLISSFLEGLPDVQKEAFIEHIQKGLSYAELEKKTGKKAPTLRKACQRAFRKWRIFIKEKGILKKDLF